MKIMKYSKIVALVVVVASINLVGCGQISRATAQLTGLSEQCVGGISYLQFASGVTVKYQPNGSIATCK